MKGYRFSKFIPKPKYGDSTFDNLLDIFLQLVSITGGDVSRALSWLTNLDKQYNITNHGYGIGDFIYELKEKGYLSEENQGRNFEVTAKTGQAIRRSALEEIFGKLKKFGRGQHKTNLTGTGDETSTDRRPFEFGDSIQQIAMTDSIRNAQINHGIGDFMMTENDLELVETEYKTQTSTVLMIDISHSMILYGEDRITPAKKVAMALAELITSKYPKRHLRCHCIWK